jgi:hypothetical protein
MATRALVARKEMHLLHGDFTLNRAGLVGD